RELLDRLCTAGAADRGDHLGPALVRERGQRRREGRGELRQRRAEGEAQAVVARDVAPEQASHRSARLRRAEEYEHLRRRSPQPGLARLEPPPREGERRVVAELRQRDRRGNLPGWILLAEHGAEPIDRAQIAELAEERGERRREALAPLEERLERRRWIRPE